MNFSLKKSTFVRPLCVSSQSRLETAEINECVFTMKTIIIIYYIEEKRKETQNQLWRKNLYFRSYFAVYLGEVFNCWSHLKCASVLYCSGPILRGLFGATGFFLTIHCEQKKKKIFAIKICLVVPHQTHHQDHANTDILLECKTSYRRSKERNMNI